MYNVHFQKFSGVACPRTSPESFLFLNQVQISSAKKICLKTLWELCPLSPFKNSCHATECSVLTFF